MGYCQGEREVIQTDSILLDHSQIAASEGVLCSDDLLYQRGRDTESRQKIIMTENVVLCSVYLCGLVQ